MDDEAENVVGRKGSRTAPEGVTRIVKTHGEIEPCKLQIKAAAPLRKFAALKEVITACDKIVEELKGKHYKLGGIYERSDAMLALYPGEGARFANHIDNTTEDGRRLTLLVYLNPGWTEADGGALRITEIVPDSDTDSNINININNNTSSGELAETRRVAVDVLPMAGRMACFLSSEIPHEVRPTYGDRFSLTIWYYDREERKQAIAKARESGTAAQMAKTSEASQVEATAFIGELMGGDEVDVDGGEPTQEELSILAHRVQGLSDEVLDIVSNITGAPSVQSFRQGFPLLTVQDLKAMRALFRRMGLQG
jgi:hypoxia-inducible factor prolyl hydroxylase